MSNNGLETNISADQIEQFSDGYPFSSAIPYEQSDTAASPDTIDPEDVERAEAEANQMVLDGLVRVTSNGSRLTSLNGKKAEPTNTSYLEINL